MIMITSTDIIITLIFASFASTLIFLYMLYETFKDDIERY